MTTKFYANYLYAEVDDEIDVLLIGFADDKLDTKNYCLLQKSLFNEHCDTVSNNKNYHITYNDEKHSCYGGITKLTFNKESIEISFNEKSSNLLKIDSKLIILFSSDELTLNNLKKHLQTMFADIPSILKVNI